MEIWKSVFNNARYQVSDLGNIKRVSASFKKGRSYPQIRGSIAWNGYRVATLRGTDGERHMPYPVHRMVMEAFHGPADLQVNHINGIKDDNRLVNLEYVTGAENRKHAMQVLDAYAKGTQHPNSKLDDDKVRQIKQMIAAGIPDKLIGAAFDCTAANIYVIRKGKGWTHVK